MAPPANPAPLGLMGFGMTTFLLNIHNAGFYPVGSMILSMGMFYGGLAQIIAGKQLTHDKRPHHPDYWVVT